MSVFNVVIGKNMVKLSLITIGSLSSTLGLRTELALITGDITTATWLAILWVFVIIGVLAYYKAEQDVELDQLRTFREHRRMLGLVNTGNTLEKPDNPILLNESGSKS